MEKLSTLNVILIVIGSLIVLLVLILIVSLLCLKAKRKLKQ